MFTIEYPEVLSLIIPILILLFKQNKKDISNHYDFNPKIIIKNNHSNINIKLLLISSIFIVIALSKPVIKNISKESSRLSSNIIFALDISYSMRCDDINPTRLKASKKILKLIAQNNNTDKFALFGFTTNMLPLSPLSYDHSLIVNSLASLNSEYILTKGTSITNLISKIKKLDYNNPLIFIFSDGGDEEIKNLKDKKLNIYPVLMATKQGSKLPIDDKFIISQLNTMFTNSNSINFTTIENTTKEILNIITNHTKNNLIKINKNDNLELYIFFIILALLFFLISILDIKPKLIILLSFIGINLHSGILNFYYIKNKDYCKIQNFEGQYNCAISLYKDGYYTKSLKLFKTLKSNDKNIKSLLFYNIGNCQYQIKDYKRAILNYQKSLELKYNNNAQLNLSLSLFKNNKMPQMKKDKNQKEGSKKFENSNNHSDNSKSSSTINLKIVTTKENKHQLGSKSYNIINKGYINEKQPW
jgi:Ca-activated chloride channel homolog